MSSDFITLSWSEDTAKLAKANVAEIIQSFKTQIVEQIEEIDIAGYLDLVTDNDDEVIEALAGAAIAIKEEAFSHSTVTYPIGTTGFNFNVAGGETWGDSPFDEFDIVYALIEAVDVVPGLGEALGILGSGIRFNYPDLR